MAEPQQGQQPRPKKFGCLRGCLVALGIGIFGAAVVAILVWQSVAWLKNAPEERIAQYEPIGLSPGEEEDVARVIAGVDEAKRNGAVYDEYLTPRVFNGAFEKILETERQKGPVKSGTPLFLRGSFEGDHMALKITAPAEGEGSGAPAEKKYINAEGVFDLAIENGEITQAKVYKLTLRGRQAPFLSRMVVNWFLGQLKEKTHLEKNSPTNDLAVIKLLRREGDRLHIVLDAKKIAEKEAAQQSAPKR